MAAADGGAGAAAATRMGDDLPPQDRKLLAETMWFHGACSRHVAESLLSNNSPKGAFLLRESETHKGQLSLSVHGANGTAQHISISRRADGGYVFGQGSFETLSQLLLHLLARPILGSSRGVVTTLNVPYQRNIKELAVYTKVVVHAQAFETAANSFKRPTLRHDSIISRTTAFDGYLTKLGHIRKNWKTRWFVLRDFKLYYYRKRRDAVPKGQIDVTRITSISRADDLADCGKKFSLKLVTKDGNSLKAWCMFADTEEEIEQWIKVIKWSMEEG